MSIIGVVGYDSAGSKATFDPRRGGLMVLADNTFSLRSIRFEAPRDLRSRKIQVRFDRRNFKRVIVYFKGECQGSGGRVDERPPGGPDSRRSAPRLCGPAHAKG